MIETKKTVEERLERIENMLEKISLGVNQAPTMVAIAADSVDEMISKAGHDGVRFEDTLGNALHLLSRLTDPKISSSLNNLLNTLEQGSGLVGIAMDTVDEKLGQINQGNAKLDDRINGVTHLLTKLSDPKMLEKLDGLIALADQSSGLIAMGMDTVDELMANNTILDPKNIDLIKKLGKALTEAQNQEHGKVGGVFGFMRTMNDPDRQKALGFLMNILKQFGKKI